jgi:hypothetical protein
VVSTARCLNGHCWHSEPVYMPLVQTDPFRTLFVEGRDLMMTLQMMGIRYVWHEEVKRDGWYIF